MVVLKPELGVAIDAGGIIVEIATEGSFEIYDPALHTQVWVDDHFDESWRLGDTVTTNPDGTFASIVHRPDTPEEIEQKENEAKPVKWKTKLRTLIAKMKDGSATTADMKRALKICMFLLASMYDEDDEPA
jgi:hypothetical protein